MPPPDQETIRIIPNRASCSSTPEQVRGVVLTLAVAGARLAGRHGIGGPGIRSSAASCGGPGGGACGWCGARPYLGPRDPWWLVSVT
jgi:hypothetical protein